MWIFPEKHPSYCPSDYIKVRFLHYWKLCATQTVNQEMQTTLERLTSQPFRSTDNSLQTFTDAKHAFRNASINLHANGSVGKPILNLITRSPVSKLQAYKRIDGRRRMAFLFGRIEWIVEQREMKEIHRHKGKSKLTMVAEELEYKCTRGVCTSMEEPRFRVCKGSFALHSSWRGPRHPWWGWLLYGPRYVCAQNSRRKQALITTQLRLIFDQTVDRLRAPFSRGYVFIAKPLNCSSLATPRQCGSLNRIRFQKGRTVNRYQRAIDVRSVSINVVLTFMDCADCVRGNTTAGRFSTIPWNSRYSKEIGTNVPDSGVIPMINSH